MASSLPPRLLPRLLAGAGLLAALPCCAPAPPPPSQPPVVAIAPPAPASATPPLAPAWEVFHPGATRQGSALLWRVEVGWSVTSRAPSCIFFVGPGSLGHLTSLGEEARLQQEASKITLSFGGNASYAGELDGNQVTLRRRAEYTYQGDLWVTTEEMAGTFASGTFEGSYRYEECDKSGKQGCPTRCVLLANLATSPTTAPR